MLFLAIVLVTAFNEIECEHNSTICAEISIEILICFDDIEIRIESYLPESSLE